MAHCAPLPRSSHRLALAVLLLLLGGFGLFAQGTEQENGFALVLRLDGPVGPASADYLVRGIESARERGAALVILEMDTPGGLESSMRDIVQAILAAPVPVVVHVTPRGARAASAGTYILYASHVAAMAPATNLGAATPVAVGGGGGLPGLSDPAEDEDGSATPRSPRNPSEAKAVNDAVAHIRGLAELRGRNADWAEAAVREAATLTASAALAEGVIEIIARDRADLLAQLDGRMVAMNGMEVELATSELALELLEPDWRTAFLSVITNPNVAIILMLIGIYGLIFEFLNPGVLIPGTLGGISLLTGLYALALLPLNYAGAALILLGIALMVAEAFAPSFGILGIGGVVALVLGATMLIDTDIPELGISVPLVAAVAVAALALTLVVVRLAIRSHRRGVVSGNEELLGAPAEVLEWSGTRGHVWLHGERWQARADAPLRPGQPVRVRGVSGLKVTVEPAEES